MHMKFKKGDIICGRYLTLVVSECTRVHEKDCLACPNCEGKAKGIIIEPAQLIFKYTSWMCVKPYSRKGFEEDGVSKVR